MKNIFKKIGFLCTALLALSLGTSVKESSLTVVEAAESTVTMSSFSSVAGDMDQYVSYVAEKGSAQNEPAIYSNIIRIYQNGGKITINSKENAILSSVTIGSNMATKIAYTIGEDTEQSVAESLVANGKYTVGEIDSESITFYCLGTDKNSRLYVNYLSATYKVDENAEPADETVAVKSLIENYYNKGTYTKVSELKVNEEAIEEITTCFHDNQTVKYRKTEYKPGELIMVTKLNESDDWGTTTSTYKDKENDKGVDHLTNGVIDYSTSGIVNKQNRDSVEDWFVTLKDFRDSEKTGWVLENGAYTYTLTSTGQDLLEDDMTRMAREFVAPMWLIPSADNWAYARFNKLTIKEVDSELVMSLYVNNTSITENQDGLFSQVAIKLPKIETSTIIFDLEKNHSLDNELGLGTSGGTGTGTFTYEGVSFGYSNIKSYDSSSSKYVLMTKNTDSYIYNKTAIPGSITKIEITIPGGSSSSAVYYLDLFNSSKGSTITSGETRKGSGSLVIEADASDAYSYFNISLKNAGYNGQISKIAITYVPATSN